MAPIVPSVEPTEIVAGSTITWTHASSLYPASEGWTLSYALAGVSVLSWSSGWVTTSGETRTILIPASSTATLDPGRYEFTRIWTGSSSYSGYRYTEALAPVTVVPDPGTQSAGDRVSFAETNLAAVEKAISARLAGDEPEEYTLGNRSVRKMTLAELRTMRAALRLEVWRLRNPGAAYPSSYVRFTRPAA